MTTIIIAIVGKAPEYKLENVFWSEPSLTCAYLDRAIKMARENRTMILISSTESEVDNEADARNHVAWAMEMEGKVEIRF